MQNRAELILPGGDLERVKIAFLYGADAVYVGLNEYSLRKAEVRFNNKEIKEAIGYAHNINKRLFVTFNIFAHNEHLKNLRQAMREIATYKPDAFIISDPGVIALAREVASDVPIHLSTQANTINIESVKFWQKQGIRRIVLGREVNLEEIKEIHKAVPKMELEIFVHGAMCISYSGRCLLSGYMTGRRSNLGDCAQPCRWNYNVYLEEKQRPGEYFPIEEDREGTNLMSSKDLRLIRYLPEIVEAGVLGLKIEGRNKSEYYLANTAYLYKKALGATYEGNYSEKMKDKLDKELEKLNYRQYTTGFLFNEAKKGETAERTPKKTWEYIGLFTNNNDEIIVKNKIKINDSVEVLTPNEVFKDKIVKLEDKNKKGLVETNPGTVNQKVFITLRKRYDKFSMLRIKSRT